MRLSCRLRTGAVAAAMTAALPAVPAGGADVCGPAGCGESRPGAAIAVDGIPCSAGFALVDAQRRRHLSTAGHCVTAAGEGTTPVGDRRWDARRGPLVTDAQGRPLARVVFAAHGEAADFALAQLLPGARVAAAPLGQTPPPRVAEVRTGDLVRLAGRTLDGTPAAGPRTGVVTGATPGSAWFTTVLAAAPGDSGGAVVAADGAAAGLLVAAGGFVLPDTGTTRVVRLRPMLARAATGLRTRFALAPSD